MDSGDEKGVIQRVLDYIYEHFNAREDLYEHAELKITFLEIYNDSVTDLLDKKLDSFESTARNTARKQPGRKAFNMSRKSSLSSLDNDHKPDQGSVEKQIEAHPRIKNRSKAKTLYGMNELEEIKSKNFGKFINQRHPSGAEDVRKSFKHGERESFGSKSRFLAPAGSTADR